MRAEAGEREKFPLPIVPRALFLPFISQGRLCGGESLDTVRVVLRLQRSTKGVLQFHDTIFKNEIPFLSNYDSQSDFTTK